MYVQIDIADTEKGAAFATGIGVSDIGMNCANVPNFKASGCVGAPDLSALKKHLGSQGLLLRGLAIHDWSWVDRVTEGEIDQKEVDNLCRTIDAMGKCKVETLIMPCSRRPLASLSPSEKLAFEERVIQVTRQLCKTADQQAVRIATHTSLMPGTMVADRGSLDRFLGAVGSKANGLLLCAGCVSLAGLRVEDFYEQYRDSVCAVHIRNLIGTWERLEETRFDMGQLRIATMLRQLARRGYDGCLIPEHFPKIAGDQRIGLAWAAAYLKGICDSIGLL